MAETFDLLLRGGTLVTHNGIDLGDIGVRDGRTVAIGDLTTASADETVDATGLHVLPGVIDTQVHFREPGNEHKEDLEAGSRGAVLGGVTAVFEMPNTAPLTTNPEALADKLARAKDRMWCEHAFYMGGTGENAEQLAELERLPGCCGVKIFMGSSTGNLLTEDDPTLRRILGTIRRRCAVHAEDEPRLKERQHLAEAAADPAAHPLWRDPETALRATKRLLAIARETGARVHVLHITTADEMRFLAQNKDIASVEATPQHLTLAAPECYAELGTRAQMNPPIRDESHRQGLWWGLDQGVVDVIGSDHAPHTLAEKAETYPASPSGMPGVQTLLPIMLDHVASNRLSLLRLMDLLCAGPARLFGIAGKGRIAVGNDGDFTLVDLAARRRISDQDMANRSGWTPFHDREVTGWPMATIIRGQIVMRDGELASRAIGRPMQFGECLPA
ncbi:MAG: dihydroorotase [Rhodospirillaceae bacterium]|jgi:dihydroorotase|nr:dihydroorotase [Rhodospirillaceae bacterium]MBT4488701.1 dihydroorotase [Rhodospirillaceae bacterium]MBT5195232.1 dihydroorotase [Rhodospirillaceae bacterium]MBT5897689.1 dihydroorotase [Rhodospirillaceae bacterium]